MIREDSSSRKQEDRYSSQDGLWVTFCSSTVLSLHASISTKTLERHYNPATSLRLIIYLQSAAGGSTWLVETVNRLIFVCYTALPWTVGAIWL